MADSGALSARRLIGAKANTLYSDLATGSLLGEHLEQLRGRTVVIFAAEQMLTAMLLIELDGVARRIVLCPFGLSVSQLPMVIQEADGDALLVGDSFSVPAVTIRSISVPDTLMQAKSSRRQSEETEWVLLTSGSTGAPKLVSHSLASLTNAFRGRNPQPPHPIWSTFYDIHRYGGLQVLLRALLTGSLVLSSANESFADFIMRASAFAVTHISGTPSHWRKAMISGALARLDPKYVRLSGEIVDQSVLDALRRTFPDSTIAHAFASTEAGVGFEVRDGKAGFPAAFVGAPDIPAEIDVSDGRLRLRSRGAARCYLGAAAPQLKSDEGFVDTGDRVERRGDRYQFVGRTGGIINVGGQKVHPEEVEAVINSLDGVFVSRVAARKNSITGAIVAADVVRSPIARNARHTVSDEVFKLSIIDACREVLPAHKVPASIRFVSSIDVSPSGKLVRSDA